MRNAACLVLALLFACGPHTRDGDGLGDDDGGGDQPDAGDGSGSGSGGGGTVYVYAHTATTLYRVDPDTLQVQMVGDFNWGPVGSDQMTDIAIDKNGMMIGVSYSRVYRVDPSTAATSLLSSSLSGTFNGLSFVPAEMLGLTGDDVLVGTENNDGKVFRIDPMTGAADVVGDMGPYSSSGDLVAIANFGTMQTVPGSSGDVLARLAPNTFAATPVGNGTGYSQLWGVAFFKDKIYGFSAGGAFVLIDPNTGAGSMVSNSGIAWWGAAVTTLAPVLE